MQVALRRRRNKARTENSRFALLDEGEDADISAHIYENDVHDANSKGGTTGTMQESHTAAWNNKGKKAMHGPKPPIVNQKRASNNLGSPSTESHVKESRSMEVGSGSAAQGPEQVSVQQTTLDGDKHKAVMVADEDGNDATNILAHTETNILGSVR